MKKAINFKKGVRGKYADKKIKILGAIKTAEKEREVSHPPEDQPSPRQKS